MVVIIHFLSALLETRTGPATIVHQVNFPLNVTHISHGFFTTATDLRAIFFNLYFSGHFIFRRMEEQYQQLVREYEQAAVGLLRNCGQQQRVSHVNKIATVTKIETCLRNVLNDGLINSYRISITYEDRITVYRVSSCPKILELEKLKFLII